MKWLKNLALTVALAGALALALIASSGSARAASGTSPTASATATANPIPASANVGVITRDLVPLRAGPDSAEARLSVLWRGDLLELRGQRGDYVRVWSHTRERGGYVRSDQVWKLRSGPGATAGLLTLLDYLSDQPGEESLGLSIAAATIQALPPHDLHGTDGAAVLDAIGRQADRLAARANEGVGIRASEQSRVTAHLEGAARHGVRFRSVEHDGRVRLCYDGDVNRRLLSHAAATPAQRARAALALTRPECQAQPGAASEREALNQQRADVLLKVAPEAVPQPWQQRLLTRRADVWSRLSYAAARRGDWSAAQAAADVAVTAVAAVSRDGLDEVDREAARLAALRTNAVRWALVPGAPPAELPLHLETKTDGRTCLKLQQPGSKAKVLAQRCTWGQVWMASARQNRERNALVVSVQPVDGWRELWVFRKTPKGWTVLVQPPAPHDPGVGYAEFAGWVPGGKSMLLAREAIAGGRTVRRFEVVSLDSLRPRRTAFNPHALGQFNRWSDPQWKQQSLALR
ncbi:hypothetical protein [Hydrogenophaga sp. 5NK40-0174]|uniref:hypothetical protein n=1 Tax=Hydrogenophaga sp. 5NK40-0174 TaxID=3127649 RepID=UPI0031067207